MLCTGHVLDAAEELSVVPGVQAELSLRPLRNFGTGELLVLSAVVQADLVVGWEEGCVVGLDVRRNASTVGSVLKGAHLARLVHSLDLGILTHAAAREGALMLRAHWDHLEVQGLAQTATHRFDTSARAYAAWWKLTFRASRVASNRLLALVLSIHV